MRHETSRMSSVESAKDCLHGVSTALNSLLENSGSSKAGLVDELAASVLGWLSHEFEQSLIRSKSGSVTEETLSRRTCEQNYSD